MKKWRRGLTLALAVLFCLVLAACGGDSGSDNNGGDVAGDDWRTTGVVDGMGTITLDGQEIDVCYCVHDDRTNFYYDDEVQVGYDLVQYPFTLDNARDSFSGCSLDDLDGDGNSDVRLEFEPEDGNDTEDENPPSPSTNPANYDYVVDWTIHYSDILGEYYEEAMKQLAESGELSEELRKFIESYFNSLK